MPSMPRGCSARGRNNPREKGGIVVVSKVERNLLQRAARSGKRAKRRLARLNKRETKLTERDNRRARKQER